MAKSRMGDVPAQSPRTRSRVSFRQRSQQLGQYLPEVIGLCIDRGLLNFNVFSDINCACTALHFDPESMPGSLAGMTAAKAGGQPITSDRSFSTRSAMQDPHANNCAIFALAMLSSSTSRPPNVRSGGERGNGPSGGSDERTGKETRRTRL